MKKVNYSIIALGLLMVSVTVIAMDEKPVERANYEYLDQNLTNAKDFTLEVLEGMPAEDFSFKPGEEMRTFGAQAFHIAYSLEWFNARLKGEPIAWEPGDEDRMSKEELITYTTEQFDSFIKIVHAAEESGAFTAGVLGALRHNSHHCGQMVAYYRANGMAPPAYK
ncbi:MAG: DinB family protein [Balneolaceae bacterium]|nr:DinB family protein [Balneolaceae bacterium]MBO6545236.1 DinB family protein [Balneolaceae bacterium]MBO6646632.1 DinB family protein [Balneolaceae bacterium]